MPSMKQVAGADMDKASRISSLSIFVEDCDAMKEAFRRDKETYVDFESRANLGKLYTKQASQAAIKQILEEVERRKHEFCKLIDEHDALVADLKKIENENSPQRVAQSPIMT